MVRSALIAIHYRPISMNWKLNASKCNITSVHCSHNYTGLSRGQVFLPVQNHLLLVKQVTWTHMPTIPIYIIIFFLRAIYALDKIDIFFILAFPEICHRNMHTYMVYHNKVKSTCFKLMYFYSFRPHVIQTLSLPLVQISVL